MKRNILIQFTPFLVVGALVFAPVQAATPDVESNNPVALGKLEKLAQCAVKRRPDKISELLRLDYRSNAYVDRMWWEAQRQYNCLDTGKLRFATVVFAGALAEQLVERAPGGVAPALTAAMAPGLPQLVARNETDVMAFCAVRAAPDATVALLATDPGSPQEKTVIRTLAPTMGKCLVAGSQAKFNAAAVRSLLALAAWRIIDNRAVHLARLQ